MWQRPYVGENTGLKRFSSDDVNVCVKDVGGQHLTNLDWRLHVQRVNQLHAVEHFFLRQRLVGFDRQAGDCGALHPYG